MRRVMAKEVCRLHREQYGFIAGLFFDGHGKVGSVTYPEQANG